MFINVEDVELLMNMLWMDFKWVTDETMFNDNLLNIDAKIHGKTLHIVAHPDMLNKNHPY